MEYWRILCEDVVTYEEQVDSEVYFNKLISIWRAQCQSLNRRLTGSVLLEGTSDEFATVYNHLVAQTELAIPSEPLSIEIRKLVARQIGFSRQCYEASHEEPCSSDQLAYVFRPVQLDPVTAESKHPHIPFPYRISCRIIDESSLRFTLSVPSSKTDKECFWLKETGYPGILKWMKRIDPFKDPKPTNRLLSLQGYTDRYRSIKETQGQRIVENWTEKTDPKKYVFEDCGIATYLLETWKRLGRSPSCFADLGCGNGLLVHLLNAEGVPGIGLDIRKRRIWDKVLEGTDLRESTIDPTLDPNGIPAGVDFLIGNHSDELTPWIPVMAARLGIDFVLIPCCPFDFHGKYNSRPGDNGSSYACFINFVKDVCQRLGYIVEEDRLSIPSTKRLCFVCTVPPEGLPSNVEEIIADLTRERDGQKAKAFVARAKKQEVRNCANITGETRTRLVSLMFNAILNASDETREGWRCGGSLPLSALIGLLSDDDKALLKQQDGGLQTFLKNAYQTFQVVNGVASLRDWGSSRQPSARAASSPCWMNANHPDGCPLGKKCTFLH